MKSIQFLLFFSVVFLHCQKVEITLGPNANDTFYIREEDASMRVLVRGNTASKAFMLIVHGGPGSSGYIYDTPKIEEIVGKDYALVFYDQRDAGASQGNANAANYDLDQYAEDLKEVIEVLKYRYGQDISLFLWSKSFGGMVASAFMTKNDYQTLVKGWMFVDASHNYGLNDSLTYQMLLDTSVYYISKGKNTESWEPIRDYCQSNPPGPFSFEQSIELNKYGWKAQKLVDGLEPYQYTVIKDGICTEYLPITNYYLGKTNAAERKFNAALTPIKFSDALGKVKTPVLVCFGRLDFVCPQGLGDDFLQHIGSSDRKKLIFERSAHHLEEQEAYYTAFRQFIFEHL